MARRRPATTHGLCIVDKPAGVTSHDVVGMLRKRFGERQVGHGGTLDPDATGVATDLRAALAAREVLEARATDAQDPFALCSQHDDEAGE